MGTPYGLGAKKVPRTPQHATLGIQTIAAAGVWTKRRPIYRKPKNAACPIEMAAARFAVRRAIPNRLIPLLSNEPECEQSRPQTIRSQPQRKRAGTARYYGITNHPNLRGVRKFDKAALRRMVRKRNVHEPVSEAMPSLTFRVRVRFALAAAWRPGSRLVQFG